MREKVLKMGRTSQLGPVTKRADMAEELSSREDFSKLVEDHDSWLFDCDGQPGRTDPVESFKKG